jgi:hypothetical protein
MIGGIGDLSGIIKLVKEMAKDLAAIRESLSEAVKLQREQLELLKDPARYRDPYERGDR